jgi:hypothetical protein
MHAEVGEAIHLGRLHREFLKEGIYFYNYNYHPAKSPAIYGKLVPILLLELSYLSWPLPNMQSSDSFKAKLFYDFRRCMKASIAIVNKIHRTPTLLIIKKLANNTFSNLMDDMSKQMTLSGAPLLVRA